MITVFCLGTYNLPISNVVGTNCVLIKKKGLFRRKDYETNIPSCIDEDTDIEKLRARAHRTIDSHYDAIAKRSA